MTFIEVLQLLFPEMVGSYKQTTEQFKDLRMDLVNSILDVRKLTGYTGIIFYSGKYKCSILFNSNSCLSWDDDRVTNILPGISAEVSYINDIPIAQENIDYLDSRWIDYCHRTKSALNQTELNSDAIPGITEYGFLHGNDWGTNPYYKTKNEFIIIPGALGNQLFFHKGLSKLETFTSHDLCAFGIQLPYGISMPPITANNYPIEVKRRVDETFDWLFGTKFSYAGTELLLEVLGKGTTEINKYMKDKV